MVSDCQAGPTASGGGSLPVKLDSETGRHTGWCASGAHERVLRLYVAGHTCREIARAVGLRSPQSVGIVVRRVGGCGVLTEFGRVVFVQRSEALLLAHWVVLQDG
jgi:hypothetical protein